MENLLLDTIAHVENGSKMKSTLKRLLTHINNLDANNCDEAVIEKTVFILRTNGKINETCKILLVNDINTPPNEYELPETPVVPSNNDTLPDLSLLLCQESQFSTSNSAAPVINYPFTSVIPTLYFKDNSNLNKHDLKNEHIEQMNAFITAESFEIFHYDYM